MVYTEILPDGFRFEMIWVKGGTFLMGSTPEVDYLPKIKKTVSGFYMSQYLVTQALWYSITGKNPSFFKGKNKPVEQVSWYDVQEFLEALTERTQKQYRLPTEAEWEFAAIGGLYAQNLNFSGSDKLKEVGWYSLNSNGQTRPVGLKLPNELGLYDMSGNIWEWCADHWHGNYEDAPVDGSAWIAGGDKQRRVVRGGSWGYSDYDCRPSNRDRNIADDRSSYIGFRIARSCPPQL